MSSQVLESESGYQRVSLVNELSLKVSRLELPKSLFPCLTFSPSELIVSFNFPTGLIIVKIRDE